MRGSVRKRGDRWYYRLELAPIDGVRQRPERYGGKTKEEAERSLRAAIKEYEDSGYFMDASNISTADYFTYWFDNYVMVNLKKNTQSNYRNIINKHILPYISQYRLKAIKPGTLQELLNSEFDKGLAKQTLSIIKGVLNKSFQMAVFPYQFLKDDPTRYIKIPKYDMKEWKDKGDLKIISFSDFKKLLDVVTPSDDFYIPMMISFQTGLRRAEVCGLMWKDIDFIEETLSVNQIMIQDGKEYEIGTPKTHSSYRSIFIGESLLQLLKQKRIRQKENKLFYGQNYFESDFVCTKENGLPITPNSIKWNTEKFRKLSGVNFNFHSFRHTHATMLLEEGAKPKEIQARLGHSRIATTMDTYAHVTKQMKKDTVNIFEAMMQKKM